MPDERRYLQSDLCSLAAVAINRFACCNHCLNEQGQNTFGPTVVVSREDSMRFCGAYSLITALLVSNRPPCHTNLVRLILPPAITLPPSPAPTPAPSTAGAETCSSYVDTPGSTLCPAGFSPVDESVSCGIGAVCDSDTCCVEGVCGVLFEGASV